MFGWLMRENKTLAERVELLDTHDSWALIAKTHRITSSFPIPGTGAVTPVQFNDVSIDSLDPEDTFFPTNDYTVQIPIGGIYNYSFHGFMVVGSTTFILFQVNGTTEEVFPMDGNGILTANGSYEADAGDTFTIALSQSSGIAFNMSASNSFGKPDNAFTVWKLEGN
jgi:hypothetical protein